MVHIDCSYDSTHGWTPVRGRRAPPFIGYARYLRQRRRRAPAPPTRGILRISVFTRRASGVSMSQPASLPSAAPWSGRAMTAEELFDLPDDSWRYALVRGELQRMTPAGFRHGAVIMNVAAPLGHHVKTHQLGVVCGAETGFVLARRPDTVLAPDVAFVRRERIAASGQPVTFWEGAPDLAVEVTSPGDTRPEMARRWPRGWRPGPASSGWWTPVADRSPSTNRGRRPGDSPPRTCWMAPPCFPDSAFPSPTCWRRSLHRRTTQTPARIGRRTGRSPALSG